MEIGFTGTQEGMTENQQIAVSSLLDVLCKEGGHVHHGDCVGADEEFHELAQGLRLRIEIHPPTNGSKRAFCKGDIVNPPHGYLVRNYHIVRCCDILIAAPLNPYEEKRSGTWYTVRRARDNQRKIFLVFPNGHIEEEGKDPEEGWPITPPRAGYSG